MRKMTGRLWVAGGLALMLAAPAAAAPAVDVEVELRYWANEVTIETTGSPDDSANAPGIGLRAEVVLIDRLAIAGEYHDLSGEDELDREPVWWYTVQFEASAAIQAFTVRNTLLTEIFDDQRNIVKFIHFPDQKQKTYSFARGEEEFTVRF